MSNLEQILETNNQLMREMLSEIKELRQITQKEKSDVCTSADALIMLGLNNTRYLTYYCKLGVLSRRKGARGFVYVKREVRALAEKLNQNKISVPSVKQIYDHA